MSYLFDKGYVPLGKSWMIRMGFLDVTRIKSRDTIEFLATQDDLGEDLAALVRVSKSILNDETILDVGESGTVRRFFQFYSWKNNLNYQFVERGTLPGRKVWNNPEIINYPIEKMRSPEIDKGTTQWQSAAILSGNEEKLTSPEPEVQMTYDADNHWTERRKEGRRWDARPDEVITEQAKAFLRMLRGEKINYVPPISEGYCFARAFDFMTTAEGAKKWPKLAGHESNRIEKMEECLAQYAGKKKIRTNDHRIVQALAMKAEIERRAISFSNEACVNKTWPPFWYFLADSSELKNTPEVFIE